MEEEGRDRGRLRKRYKQHRGRLREKYKHNRKGSGKKERKQILQVVFKKATRRASSTLLQRNSVKYG